jgi:hypothetical protein
MRVCIVGASGKLGQYMIQHALDRGYPEDPRSVPTTCPQGVVSVATRYTTASVARLIDATRPSGRLVRWLADGVSQLFAPGRE